ncbi:MAG: hypothetical protein ACI82A_001478 [Candidatus Azotimanducaceae bacterium]|jgi:uncharacterized protein YbbC (DUF1343 family)
MQFQFGLDKLLSDNARISQISKRSIALVAHPASVTDDITHSLDALIAAGLQVKKAFGPQHGIRGDKQDNMIESEDFLDPVHGIPMISLYGQHRRPTPEMLSGIDLILFDLQDVGCRIYTYITTLKYFLEAAAELDIEVWVLDRPNPAGRPVDGMRLVSGQESFVGADTLPTRHGLTTGELALWFKQKNNLEVILEVVPMVGYEPNQFTWPDSNAWINPSPNAASVNMTRCFPGTVLLEGTKLSEGRGTTIPLELIGAPDFPAREVLNGLQRAAPDWCAGVSLRVCNFEPTFHKHVHELCHGIQIHTDNRHYQHELFTPYRFIAGCLKVLRQLRPDYDLWRHHEYEYELNRVPLDVINGGPGLRLWVDDPVQSFDDLEQTLQRELAEWLEERAPYLIY